MLQHDLTHLGPLQSNPCTPELRAYYLRLQTRSLDLAQAKGIPSSFLGPSRVAWTPTLVGVCCDAISQSLTTKLRPSSSVRLNLRHLSVQDIWHFCQPERAESSENQASHATYHALSSSRTHHFPSLVGLETRYCHRPQRCSYSIAWHSFWKVTLQIAKVTWYWVCNHFAHDRNLCSGQQHLNGVSRC